VETVEGENYQDKPRRHRATYHTFMRIVRLFWAGIQICCDQVTLVIDLLEDVAPIRSLLGNPRLPVVSAPEVVDVALVTHLHPDHYDADTLRKKLRPDAKVFCDPANVAKISRHGFHAVRAASYESISVGPFTVTALPAVDGLGDPQVSFLVEADGVKVMHFGDTLWHGYWWQIRARCGVPDLTFLPVNGAITQFPRMKASGVAADLMPDQAAAAAAILETKIACPIHYGAFHNPPLYAEWPNAERIFFRAAEQLGVNARLIQPGCEVALV